MTLVAPTSPAIAIIRATIRTAAVVPARLSTRVVMGRGFGSCAARIREHDGDASLIWRIAGNSRARFAGRSGRCAAQDQPNQRTGGKAKNDPCGHDAPSVSKGLPDQKMGRNR